MKRLICLVLCAALLSALPCAYAEEDERPHLDSEELTQLVDSVLDELKANKDQVSVGLYATATDEVWYYNEDLWLYSASLYKVPLIMLLEQKIAAGEIAQDGKIGSLDVDYIKGRILQYSNNELAQMLRKTVWHSDVAFRQEAMSLVEMTEEDFSDKYLPSSRFNVRFMTEVMKNLYFHQDEYPDMLGYLLLASPGAFFKVKLEDRYEIAQKYGAYDGVRHTSGVIYTPNPIILTVMTGKTGGGERIIAAMAEAFADYAEELDRRIEEYDARIQAEEEARLEAERLKAEEEAAEKARLEAEAAELARLEREAEEERLEAEANAAAQEAAEEARRKNTAVAVASLGSMSAVLAAAVSRKKGKKR